MKFFIIVCLLAVFSSALAITDEQKVKLKEHYSLCAQETGADKELIKKVKEGDTTITDDKINEFTLCIFKRIGIFTDDGKILKEVALTKVEDSIKDLVSKSFDKCMDVTGETLPLKAWNFWICYRKERGHIEVL